MKSLAIQFVCINSIAGGRPDIFHLKPSRGQGFIAVGRNSPDDKLTGRWHKASLWVPVTRFANATRDFCNSSSDITEFGVSVSAMPATMTDTATMAGTATMTGTVTMTDTATATDTVPHESQMRRFDSLEPDDGRRGLESRYCAQMWQMTDTPFFVATDF